MKHLITLGLVLAACGVIMYGITEEWAQWQGLQQFSLIVAALAGVALMLEMRKGPFDLAVLVLLHSQAFCLAVREELAELGLRFVTRHRSRVRRVQQRHGLVDVAGQGQGQGQGQGVAQEGAVAVVYDSEAAGGEFESENLERWKEGREGVGQ